MNSNLMIENTFRYGLSINIIGTFLEFSKMYTHPVERSPFFVVFKLRNVVYRKARQVVEGVVVFVLNV